MEFAQTFTSKNNEKNATSNNAQCINDQSSHGLSLQRKASVANNTGLPDSLKSGVESLSGYSLDDVRVHYNSSKPAAVQAYAYTQGTDIHIAPGQERCLPHEAWHVTQQMSGRVSPTTSIGGVAVNDNAALEHEADVMGARASTLQGNNYAPVSRKAWSGSSVRQNKSLTIQRNGPSGDTKSVMLRDDDACIESFASDEYKMEHYKVRNGHFDVTYNPGSRRLDVNLPVYYGNDMDVQDAEGGLRRKEYFKKNIEDTWSSRGSKHHINFRRSRSEKLFTPSKGWESKLNGTNVGVTVEEKTSSSDAYFNLQAVHDGSSVDRSRVGREVELRENSFQYGSGDLEIDGENYHFATLNPTAHEAGHMFGLGDEYRTGQGANKKADGTHSSHYDMVKDFFDEKYANDHAVRHDSRDSDDPNKDDLRKGTSIMRDGDTVEAHHYVTFADAMVQAIQKKFPSIPSPDAPNTRGDWTID